MTISSTTYIGPILYLVGVPLDEEAPLSQESRAVLAKAQVIIGESRKITYRYLKESNPQQAQEVFLMDPPREDEKAFMKEALTKLKQSSGVAALLSDTGMPVLFDPGVDVLEFCRQQGFCIRTVPSATSWSTAAAASGFGAPFFVAGFPPREETNRKQWWGDLKTVKYPIVIMETPYRFRLLLKQAKENLGAGRKAFLAWEISKPTEILLWGTLDEIERNSQRLGLEKGEFILCADAISSPKKRNR